MNCFHVGCWSLRQRLSLLHHDTRQTASERECDATGSLAEMPATAEAEPGRSQEPWNATQVSHTGSKAPTGLSHQLLPPSRPAGRKLDTSAACWPLYQAPDQGCGVGIGSGAVGGHLPWHTELWTRGAKTRVRTRIGQSGITDIGRRGHA